MNLGENIHTYRTQQNMSQGELANMLDVSRQSVSKWENNLALPELDKLISAGKTVIMATQVTQEGSDLSVYQVGQRIKKRYRLLETYDMTLESTVTKLMWALGQSDDPAVIRKLFCTTVNYDLLF